MRLRTCFLPVSLRAYTLILLDVQADARFVLGLLGRPFDVSAGRCHLRLGHPLPGTTILEKT